MFRKPLEKNHHPVTTKSEYETQSDNENPGASRDRHCGGSSAQFAFAAINQGELTSEVEGWNYNAETEEFEYDTSDISAAAPQPYSASPSAAAFLFPRTSARSGSSGVPRRTQRPSRPARCTRRRTPITCIASSLRPGGGHLRRGRRCRGSHRGRHQDESATRDRRPVAHGRIARTREGLRWGRAVVTA